MKTINFFIEIKSGQQPIIKIANMVIVALGQMSIHDKVFKTAYFLYKNESIGFDTYNKEKSAIELANHILNYSLKDINRFEKIENPDINYSRPYGFTFGLQFKEAGKKVLSLTFKLGSNSNNFIGTISISKDLNRDLNWYKYVIDSFVQTGNVKCASARPNDTMYLEQCIKLYRFILGFITYFSNDYGLQIPNDLKDIEYEHISNGKYLVLKREDFTTNEEIYEAHKQRLLNVMEEIKQRVPEYGF